MNVVTLTLRNAFRSKRRTLLTIFSLGITVFGLANLATFLEGFGYGLDEVDALGRLITKRRTSLMDMIPESLKTRIEGIDGVKFAHGTIWFGGKVPGRPDVSNPFFANFADDPLTFGAVNEPTWASMTPPDAIERFLDSRQAAIVGPELLERFGWSIGDGVTLEGTIYGVNPKVTIVGTYKAKVGFDDKVFYFRRDYLDEMLKKSDPDRAGKVGVYVVKYEAGKGPAVAAAIDAMTRNSDAETETVTEKEFQASFAEMMGNLKVFITWIGGAIALSSLLVAGNTMAMTARERSNEAAVMRTLGFPRWYVVALFLAEGLLVTVGAGFLGLGGATLLYAFADFQAGGFFVEPLRVSRDTFVLGSALVLAIGLIASGLPALIIARRSIVAALRRVV